MSKSNRNGIIVSVIFVGIAFLAYKILSENKESYAKTIMKWNGSTASIVTLVDMDEGYLKAWAKALEKAKPVFSFNNKQYSTNGGSAVQNQ